jgi:F-type H+-transporting ATPase subunit b
MRYLAGLLLLVTALALPVCAAEEHADEAAHATAGEAASKPNPLAVDPDLALWTLIIFGVLCAVLYKTAWGPISKALHDREEGIANNIAAAAAKHEEAKAMLAAHEARLAAAADEVRGLLEEARRDAEATKVQIVAEAKAAADAEKQRVVKDIEQARDVAVRQLAESSAGLAIDLAKKVVKQEITSSRQDEIVREAISRFASSKN